MSQSALTMLMKKINIDMEIVGMWIKNSKYKFSGLPKKLLYKIEFQTQLQDLVFTVIKNFK